MSKKLLFQGAEAKIFLESNIILKSRVPKSYRHPDLDNKIRTQRTRHEAKVLAKALECGVNVPKVLAVDKFDLQIEFIEGDRLSDKLNSYDLSKQLAVMGEIGNQVSTIHDNDIIHGDLTTSNIILSNEKIFLIDFGLGFISKKIEDKAVDIHLIKQALEAKHFQDHTKLFEKFLEVYNPKDREKILERLDAVEKRGRYRH